MKSVVLPIGVDDELQRLQRLHLVGVLLVHLEAQLQSALQYDFGRLHITIDWHT